MWTNIMKAIVWCQVSEDHNMFIRVKSIPLGIKTHKNLFLYNNSVSHQATCILSLKSKYKI